MNTWVRYRSGNRTHRYGLAAVGTLTVGALLVVVLSAAASSSQLGDGDSTSLKRKRAIDGTIAQPTPPTADSTPPNDHCADALLVGVPSSTLGTTLESDVDTDAHFCWVGVTAPGVWYRVSGTGNTMTATTCNAGTQFDSKITVYCDNCGNLGPESCVDGNDDNCSDYYQLFSTVTWCSQYGADYLILVHGYGSASGDFVLDVFDDGSACYGAVDCGGDAIGGCCISGGGTCTPGICGDFAACGGDGCVCALSAEGDGVCTNGLEFCMSLPPCPNGSSDCPSGRFCWIGSCCDGPVCGQPCAGTSLGGKALQSIDLDLMPIGSTPVTDETNAVTSCVEIPQTSCESAGGDYQGDGVHCELDPCSGDLGACCVSVDCVGVMVETACEGVGGLWFLGEDCMTVTCPIIQGACCPGYACAEGFVCGGSSGGYSCNDTLGCICVDNAEGGISCVNEFQACGSSCPNGSSDCAAGSTCALNTCCNEGMPTCTIDGCPLPLPPERQLGPGEADPVGTVPADPFENAAVVPAGCLELESVLCETVGGTYQGDSTVCLEDTCPVPGACCFNDGNCVDALADECAILSGDFSSEGTTCIGDQDGDGVDEVCEGVFCGDGVVDVGEDCDGGVCCTDECLFDDMTVCRPATGGCDVAEACSGTSAECPTDEYLSVGAECRSATGACDMEEVCDGVSADCPGDVYASAGVGCRPAAGVCDVAESCEGVSPQCPANELAAVGTECRISTGDCDPAEVCTGVSTVCPADVGITDCVDDDDCCPEGCEFVTDNDCVSAGIPTASAWGLLIMAIVLLTGAKAYFSRRLVGRCADG